MNKEELIKSIIAGLVELGIIRIVDDQSSE